MSTAGVEYVTKYGRLPFDVKLPTPSDQAVFAAQFLRNFQSGQDITECVKNTSAVGDAADNFGLLCSPVLDTPINAVAVPSRI